MTTTIVIGENSTPKTLKPIVFEKYLRRTFEFDLGIVNPAIWKYIELITKNYSGGKDLMFAYDDPLNRDAGYLYIGKWNDGVVE